MVSEYYIQDPLIRWA